MTKDKQKEKAAAPPAAQPPPALAPAAPAAAEPARPGKMGAMIGIALATLIAAGAGAGLGTMLAGNIEAAVTAKVEAIPEKPPTPPVKYSGDLVIRDLKPVIANLAAPSSTWIRLETAIIFENGAVENAEVTAAEIEQDVLAYVRTITLDQLQGPSAFEHLRDDLNERVAIRTEKSVRELVIKTMVVQ